MIFKIIKCGQKINLGLIEMVERKGIGHPDTLADIIAETLSNNYSRYCLDSLGVILNHWFDKVTLSGAKAEIQFGKAKIIKPITVYLFGKATTQFGSTEIPLKKIFKDSVEAVFLEIFKNTELLKNIKYVIDINDGIGSDHLKEFYSPSNTELFKQNPQNFESNDTVMCSAYKPYTDIERLTIQLEGYINSKKFKEKYSATGWDVKVMITKVRSKVDVTICIPFIAKLTPSLDYYQNRIYLIKLDLEKKIKKIYKNKVSLYINTKDKDKYAYLTVFGSALDKGDYGCVGRGNRYNGLITVNQEMNIEASAGKNPIHHTGKLYNIIADQLSSWLYCTYGIRNEVNISTQNGNLLSDPSFVLVKMIFTKK